MYLLIAVWGGPRKDYASIKFFIYTLFGSVFLLVAIIAIYLTRGPSIYLRPCSGITASTFQIWVFLAFALAFAIKVPMFPFHTWLPAAHTEAPTAGSVFLASVLLKMGTYGFLRFCLPITPKASVFFAPLYHGPFRHRHHLRRICLPEPDGHEEAHCLFQRGPHGFCHAGHLLLHPLRMAGGPAPDAQPRRYHRRAFPLRRDRLRTDPQPGDLRSMPGLGKSCRIYVGFFGLFSISSFAFPGTNNFVGEIYVLIGTFTGHKLAGFFSVVGAVLAAAYMLRLLKQIVWGREDQTLVADMNAREICVPCSRWLSL